MKNHDWVDSELEVVVVLLVLQVVVVVLYKLHREVLVVLLVG
jgi:hypothetical protein